MKNLKKPITLKWLVESIKYATAETPVYLRTPEGEFLLNGISVVKDTLDSPPRTVLSSVEIE